MRNILIAVIMLTLICPAAQAQENQSTESDFESLYGTYAFEKQLYMNPLSSFLALDGFMEYYTFSEGSLMFTDFEGRRRLLTVNCQEAPVDEEAYRNGFMMEWPDFPDLSGYEKARQYTFTGTDETYRLYQLDSDYWLARIHKDNSGKMKSEYIWSIYKITRFDGELPLKTTQYGIQDSSVDLFVKMQPDFDSGYENDECYNITPDAIRYTSDYSIFKYSQSCASFLMYENEIYPMGEWFGGLGVTSMVLCDMNQDGLFELYFTYSFGSGLHRGSAAYFDPAIREVIPFDYAYPNSDMIVAPNEKGGLSLYAASVVTMDSFVKMELEKTGLLLDIEYTGGKISLSPGPRE